MAISKSSEAVMWLQQNPQASQNEAAEKFGIKASTLSHALAKRATGEMCPCCGQTMNKRAAPVKKGQNKP